MGVSAGALVALSLAGCGTTPAPAKKQFTIALVPGIIIDPFYITMHAGAAAEAKKLGVKLIWEGSSTWSPETQTPILQSLLAQHPSALLTAPTDAVAMAPVLKQYVAAHIPVITVDTTINDTSLLVSRISSDNVQGGAAAADTCARLMHDHGSVAVENTLPGITTTDLRQQGFAQEIKKYPNMHVVSMQYDQDHTSVAESQSEAVMLAHPNLGCIFGTNLYSAQGAGAAVKAEHRQGKVFVAGYDAEPAEVALLKSGVINILVVQQPALEGKLAVLYAYDYLTGHKHAFPRSILLPNVIATSANANDPSVSKYFYLQSFSG